MIFSNKILLFESILRLDDTLDNKYFLTITRNLLEHLKKIGYLKNKGSRSIKKDTLVSFLRHLGHKNHSLRYLYGKIKKFQESRFVQSHNADFITLKPKTEYEGTDYYISSFTESEKFTFNQFKKKAIEFLYSKPIYLNRSNRKEKFLYFTSQRKIAETLGLSQSTISKTCKSHLKLYAFKYISRGYKRWDNAKEYLLGSNGVVSSQYGIVTNHDDGKYYVVKLQGSKLVNNFGAHYRYKNHKSKKSYRGKLKNHQAVNKISNNLVSTFDGKTEIYIRINRLHESFHRSTETDYLYLLSRAKTTAKFHTVGTINTQLKSVIEQNNVRNQQYKNIKKNPTLFNMAQLK